MAISPHRVPTKTTINARIVIVAHLLPESSRVIECLFYSAWLILYTHSQGRLLKDNIYKCNCLSVKWQFAWDTKMAAVYCKSHNIPIVSFNYKKVHSCLAYFLLLTFTTCCFVFVPIEIPSVSKRLVGQQSPEWTVEIIDVSAIWSQIFTTNNLKLKT